MSLQVMMQMFAVCLSHGNIFLLCLFYDKVNSPDTMPRLYCCTATAGQDLEQPGLVGSVPVHVRGLVMIFKGLSNPNHSFHDSTAQQGRAGVSFCLPSLISSAVQNFPLPPPTCPALLWPDRGFPPSSMPRWPLRPGLCRAVSLRGWCPLPPCHRRLRVPSRQSRPHL